MSDFNFDWISFEPSVAFDVGSCNGNFSSKLKERFPQCRTIAIEASPRNFEKMKANPKLKAAGVEVFHKAVCDKDAEITFHDTSGRLIGSGSIHKPNKNLYRYATEERPLIVTEVTVPSTRLDTLCRTLEIGEIDILHVDVQGAENEVVAGLGDLRPKLMFLEMGGSSANCYENTVDPTSRLEALGYKRLVKLPGDQLWGLPEFEEAFAARA